jgi:hypothetical protein
MVGNSTHNPEIEGLNPSSDDREWEKIAKKSFVRFCRISASPLIWIICLKLIIFQFVVGQLFPFAWSNKRWIQLGRNKTFDCCLFYWWKYRSISSSRFSLTYTLSLLSFPHTHTHIHTLKMIWCMQWPGVACWVFLSVCNDCINGFTSVAFTTNILWPSTDNCH